MDFVSRHLEVEEAATALKLLRAGATLTDHQTTPAKVVQDPPIPVNSQTQSSPIIINETSDHRSGLSRSKPADVKSACHFHLQGRCKHGRIGTGCKYSHPNMCKKIILKGERGCSNGDKCRFTCCCLPTPMTLASGGSPMFPHVVHQPASPSIWPAVQSLRRGLSTNPGVTMWCVCGCS